MTDSMAVVSTRRFAPAALTDLPEVLEAVQEVCTAAGAPASVVADVRLAVEEAFTNIVTHGYGGVPGPVDLEIRITGDAIVVRLEDAAAPFDPTAVSSPGLADEWRDRKIGGLGWHLIGKVMDEVRHEPRQPAGNVLILVKRVPSPR